MPVVGCIFFSSLTHLLTFPFLQFFMTIIGLGQSRFFHLISWSDSKPVLIWHFRRPCNFSLLREKYLMNLSHFKGILFEVTVVFKIWAQATGNVGLPIIELTRMGNTVISILTVLLHPDGNVNQVTEYRCTGGFFNKNPLIWLSRFSW